MWQLVCFVNCLAPLSQSWRRDTSLMRCGMCPPLAMQYTYRLSVGAGWLLHVTHFNLFKRILISYHHISERGSRRFFCWWLFFCFFLLMSSDSGVLPICGLPFLRKPPLSQHRSESVRKHSLRKFMWHLIGVHDVVFFNTNNVCIIKEDKSIRQQATTPIEHQNYTFAKDQRIVPRNI